VHSKKCREGSGSWFSNSNFTTKDTKGAKKRQKKFFFIPFVFFVSFVVQTFKMRIPGSWLAGVEKKGENPYNILSEEK
jgi:hypothetical protein